MEFKPRMFSYDRYKQIVKHLSVTLDLPIKDYTDISKETDRFLLVRHDVEYSPQRALRLARFEHEHLSLKSSYFFQIRNNTYNLLSDVNLGIVKEITEMGHNIGLHVHTGLWSGRDLSSFVKKEINLMESATGLSIDRFSYHRPKISMLSKPLRIEGKINAYDPLYFHFFESNLPKTPPVTYISDSNHRWKFGHPLDLKFGVNKVHLLTHPFSWTEDGYENISNFKSLIEEKNAEMIESIDREIKTFPPELKVIDV